MDRVRREGEVGPRIVFAGLYRAAFHCSMSLLDLATGPSIRADIAPINITEKGFDVQFRTWGDSRVARIRVAWMAIGEHPDSEAWELY